MDMMAGLCHYLQSRTNKMGHLRSWSNSERFKCLCFCVLSCIGGGCESEWVCRMDCSSIAVKLDIRYDIIFLTFSKLAVNFTINIEC